MGRTVKAAMHRGRRSHSWLISPASVSSWAGGIPSTRGRLFGARAATLRRPNYGTRFQKGACHPPHVAPTVTGTAPYFSAVTSGGLTRMRRLPGSTPRPRIRSFSDLGIANSTSSLTISRLSIEPS